MTPDISCIIPVYNGLAQLERAVASALSQQGVATEVILIDDGSEAPTRALIARLAAQDARVRPFLLPDNGGQSRARNLGGQLARAPLVTFLDQDDEHAPHWYAHAHHLLAQHPTRGALSGRAQVVDLPARLAVADDDLRLRGLSAVFMTNVVCRRSVFLASGGFPTAAIWRSPSAGEDSQYREVLARHWNPAGCEALALIHHAREGGATVYFLDRSRVEGDRVVVTPNQVEQSGALAQANDDYLRQARAMAEDIRRCLGLEAPLPAAAAGP